MKPHLAFAFGSSVVCALMLSMNAQARDFSEIINHPPPEVIRAIDHILVGSPNIRPITADRKNGVFRFRVVVDDPNEAVWSEHWSGIYVSIHVRTSTGGKSAVHLSVNRFYPPPWEATYPREPQHTLAEEEESCFSHLFLSFLKKEFFV
jgi:hypothetical protein